MTLWGAWQHFEDDDKGSIKIVMTGQATVDNAIQCALNAAPIWQATPPAERAAILERAADLMEGMALKEIAEGRAPEKLMASEALRTLAAEYGSSTAKALAAADDTMGELTQEHWDVIKYLRDMYFEENEQPMERVINKGMSKIWGRKLWMQET